MGERSKRGRTTCPCPVNRCFQDKPQPSFCASNIVPMPTRGESEIRWWRGKRSNGPISWHSHILDCIWPVIGQCSVTRFVKGTSKKPGGNAYGSHSYRWVPLLVDCRSVILAGRMLAPFGRCQFRRIFWLEWTINREHFLAGFESGW